SGTGAQLTLAFAKTDTTQYSFALTAPDGSSKTWAGGTTAPQWLTAPSLAGAQIQGVWKLVIANGSGISNVLYGTSFLFVEGIARRQETAGAIFDWGVYADPAHLGENGTPANFAAARATIQKLAFAHTVGNLVQSIAPYPNMDSGVSSSIPNECCPT